MKSFTPILVAVLLCSSLNLSAQMGDNFNTRGDAMAPNEIRETLISSGWWFSNSSIQTSSAPVIEGNGYIQTSPITNTTTPYGVTSPLFRITGTSITVNFKYQIAAARTLYVALINCEGAIVQVLDESATITGGIVTYSRVFTAIPGNCKLIVGFKGSGPAVVGNLDVIDIQGVTMYYTGGANSIPVGTPDNLTGNNLRQASGNVLANDYDSDNDPISAQIFENPAPNVGTINLNSDGSFVFTPAPGFTGSGVIFKYMVCEDNCQQLCSEPVQVMISFPQGTVTPVMMLSFNGVLSNGNVQLNWSTSTELDNSHFEIERSENDLNYTKIGSIKGNGTSGVIQQYSFTNAVGTTNAPVLYYRLKQVDLNGRFVYSKTEIVRLTIDIEKGYASVAPNPVQGAARLAVTLEKNSPVQVRLLTKMGQELAHKHYKGLKGTNYYSIDETNNLSPDMYLLEILVEGKNRQLIKILK